MARIREGKKTGPVAVPKLAAKKGGPGGNSSAANGGPHPMQGVIELPKRPSVEDVVSQRIIVAIGGGENTAVGTFSKFQSRGPLPNRRSAKACPSAVATGVKFNRSVTSPMA